eukprot:NODE_247_length_11822_cov_1.182718.p7 type:complete len:223 gc:universal NODE_247_length_11822_cov_1.182718:7115-7783(+)
MQHIFSTKAQLTKELLSSILQAEKTHFEKYSNKPFVVAVAGGSLPSMLKDLKPECPEKWKVILADERIVPIEHEDSNGKLLLENMSYISKDNIILINNTLAPQECAKDYEQKISAILPISLALLGMGPDGHICSLFPGHKLLNSTSTVDYIIDSPKPPPKRVTLTFPILNDDLTDRYLIATGGGKSSAIKKSILNKDKSLPVSHLKDLQWWLDEEAAKELPK